MATASAWSEPLEGLWFTLTDSGSASVTQLRQRTFPSERLHARHVVSAVQCQRQRPPLQTGLSYEEVEAWQRFPYLMTGYRRAGMGYWQCMASMFALHNESFNAWSMVASTVAGALLLWYTLVLAKPIGWDCSPFWVHFAAQLAHFPASLGYHTFMPISAATAHRWRRADLCLVIVLNIACNYSLTYFTIGSQAALGLTALACMSGGMGIYSIINMQQGKPLNRTRMVIKVAGTAAGYYAVMLYRAVAAAAAATRLPPAASIHTLRSQESVWTFLPRWMQCPEVVTVACMLLCHGLGALVYATHWPQCYYPRVFDLCGFSHNFMHVFCFVIYCWGYLYVATLHAKQDQW